MNRLFHSVSPCIFAALVLSSTQASAQAPAPTSSEETAPMTVVAKINTATELTAPSAAAAQPEAMPSPEHASAAVPPSAAVASPSKAAPRVALAPPPQEEAASRWYGYQTIPIDIVAIAAASFGGITPGVVLFLGGPPAVHLLHGRPGAAVGSVALRLALPLLGATALTSLSGDHGEKGLFGSVVGAGFGVIAAAAIDDVVLARETVAAPTASAPRPVVGSITPHTESGFRWAPTAAPVRGGVVAGISGAF